MAALDQTLAEQARAPAKSNLPSQKIESSTDVAVINEPAPSKQLITEIQSRLNSLGYNVGAPDGKAGPRTQQAIQAFQSRVGITADGEASQGLLNSLKNTPLTLARAAPANTAAAAQSRSTGKNTEVRGRLVLQRANNGTLVGCSIKGVQLDLSWCQPFIARQNTRNCKAIIRPNSKVLLVKCG